MTTAPAEALTQSEWAACTWDLIWCYRGRVPAGDRQAEVVVPNWAAWRILAGEARVRLRDGTRRCAEAGRWMVLPPGARAHDFRADHEILSLHFTGFWSDGSPTLRGTVPLVLPADPVLDEFAAAIQGFFNLDSEHREHWPRMRLSASRLLALRAARDRWLSRLLELLPPEMVTGRPAAPGDPRLERLLRAVRATPPGEAWPVTRMARVAGLSVPQLGRVFREALGTTPARFRQDRLLHEARHSLTSGKPVKEVALALGFADLSRFSRWFRRLTGESPRQFRQRGSGA